MDRAQRAPEQPALTGEVPPQAAGARSGFRQAGFTREEHQALHGLTLGNLVFEPPRYRTIADVTVSRGAVDKLIAMGLARRNWCRDDAGHRAYSIIEITERGRMVAELLGAPGLFPLRELAED